MPSSLLYLCAAVLAVSGIGSLVAAVVLVIETGHLSTAAAGGISLAFAGVALRRAQERRRGGLGLVPGERRPGKQRTQRSARER